MPRTRPAIYCVQSLTAQARYSKQTRRSPYLFMTKQGFKKIKENCKSSPPPLSLTLVNHNYEDI